MTRLYIGTSGWAYPEWNVGIYAGVPRAVWLEHYAELFNAVEVNATFYHLLKPGTLKGWRNRTPKAFRFCIKASRYLTHIQRLDVSRESLSRLRTQAVALSPKLSCILWQLPATLHCDLDLLARFVRMLRPWGGARHAIEFRHQSWFIADVAACLGAHDVASVHSHAADWPMWDAVTTDLVYIRLHGGVRTYESAYRTRTLSRWAQRIRDWRTHAREVHVYFDNTAGGHAPADALRLQRIVGI